MNMEEMDESVKKSLDEIDKLFAEEKKLEADIPKKDVVVNPTSTKINKDTVKVVEEVEVLERLHLRIMDDTIDVLYRPNHDYICFVKNNEEGLETIKKLAEMSREDFYNVLKESSSFRFSSKRDINSIRQSNKEDWYLKAWSITTKQIFDKLKIANPIEEPFTV